MVCLGFKPGVAGWKAQTNPLSYGGTPNYYHDSMIFYFYLQIYDLSNLVHSKLSAPQVNWIEPIWVYGVVVMLLAAVAVGNHERLLNLP